MEGIIMGVASNFESFCKNLRMSSEVVDNISYRTKRITKQLNKDFWDSTSDTNHSFYSGSYGRGTDIYTSDIDLLMILPYSYYEKYNNYKHNGQSALLQAVKESIENTYKSYKRADGQVVKVDFTDGISYEIVPCFLNDDNESYTYPDTNGGGSWKTTNPKAEIKAFNEMNKESNKNLKRLCRMMRAWKNKNNVQMSGYLIDTLCYRFMQNWSHKKESYLYYDWMVRDFFDFLINQSQSNSYWFVPGSNRKITSTHSFEYKAKQAKNLALKAIDYQSDGKEYSAKQEWRNIFGTKFPS